MTVSRFLNGIVVEASAESWTGKYLYSDFAVKDGVITKNTLLNDLVQIPFIGIVAGVARVALGAIHTIGHLFASVLSKKSGHLYHAGKGLAEMLRGIIEATPLIGRIFANLYMPIAVDGRCWWMIKIYNPNRPDGLDVYMNRWERFKRDMGPQFYVIA